MLTLTASGKRLAELIREKFAELVGKDPALLAKLGLDKVNADAAADLR